jgi:hypothetical protein
LHPIANLEQMPQCAREEEAFLDERESYKSYKVITYLVASRLVCFNVAVFLQWMDCTDHPLNQANLLKLTPSPALPLESIPNDTSPGSFGLIRCWWTSV